MDKMRKEINDGMQANDIINHPLVRMALDGMRDQIKSGFSAQTTYNQDLTKEMWLALRIIDKFEQALKTVVDTGKMAEIELEKQTWAERAKRVFR